MLSQPASRSEQDKSRDSPLNEKISQKSRLQIRRRKIERQSSGSDASRVEPEPTSYAGVNDPWRQAAKQLKDHKPGIYDNLQNL
jgi:hypothetical protein